MSLAAYSYGGGRDLAVVARTNACYLHSFERVLARKWASRSGLQRVPDRLRKSPLLAQARQLMLAGTALTLGLLGANAGRADEVVPFLSRDTYGEVGILEIPTARMSRDGQIAATVGAMKNTQRINLTFQVLPWLEGSFRYSHLAKFGSTGNYFDRSFGMKVRFWQEGDVLPEVSVGIRDLIGTGIYGTEYLVASKRFGDLDFTAGLGWGRLSDIGTLRNPFGLIFPSFDKRAPFSGPGGQVNFGNFFHGPRVGVFGGVIWRTPISGLDVLAEYSGDKYVREVATGNAKWRIPLNVGVAYRPLDRLSVTAGWLSGTTWTVILSLALDPTTPIFPFHVEPPVAAPVIRDAQQQQLALKDIVAPGPIETGAVSQTPLKQALANNFPGVQDFEVSGSTLMVDVLSPRGVAFNCPSYAAVVSGVRPDLRTVAITNLNDPSGAVEVCSGPAAPRNAQLVSFSLGHAGHATTGNGLRFVDGAAEGGGASLQQQDLGAIEKQMRAIATAQGIDIQASYFGLSEATVYYENKKYFSEAAAAGRLGRILMALAPPTVEIFHLIVTEHGIPLRQFDLIRSALERSATVNGGTVELGEAVSVTAPDLDHPILDNGIADSYPRYSWSFSPRFRQSVFDPNAPYQVQFFVSGKAAVDILPGLTVSTKVDANVWNNFVVQPNNSLLPHVRSDVSLYKSKGATGIETLMAEYRTRLAPDVFAKVKAGYLEDMFAGVGAEVLWRPNNEPFALGADVYQVWQRSFDRLFGLRPYQVITGHVSLYYSLPWYGLHANIHVGRYLAGDYGGTIELSRRFADGVEIGAYATFTNVPFAKFGEGSFDKGIIVRIPLEWPLPIRSPAVYDFTLRSLSRDGGQRLEDDDSLYGETIRTGYGEIYGHINDVTNP